MPELPEIETIKNDLAPQVVGEIIIGVTFSSDPKLRILRRYPSTQRFIREIKKSKIIALRRRAKWLIFELSLQKTLIIHLGMSGQLVINHSNDNYQPFIQAIFHLSNEKELRFIDPRKFGEIFLKCPPHRSSNTLNIDHLGPEPLGPEFTLNYLKQILRESKQKIKTLLMDQKKIAGIGNIYSDEILFQTKIHPARIASSLNSKEINQLHQSIRKILSAAIKNRGTTAADQRFRDGWGNTGKFQEKLKVYQRKGQSCYYCKTAIATLRIGGRNASFCPVCQS
ncbi:MAG: bifunctional DNA-formamidopyrimidine glycosylase/DNA-(apurinic or apyrimidinic site) lyase [Desulfobacterota bacterium]|nr:bifunctional DNA-formamidopyrimidine glycosylase/DNA-(apurinic or apyrimidinic site) lyase [Thermodesulfobacteriota bacterium]